MKNINIKPTNKPSSESVDVKTWRNPNGKIVCHKIIIPKEEHKQEIFNEIGNHQQELFSYLHNELGVLPLQSQMNDIEEIVLKMQKKNKK